MRKDGQTDGRTDMMEVIFAFPYSFEYTYNLVCFQAITRVGDGIGLLKSNICIWIACSTKSGKIFYSSKY